MLANIIITIMPSKIRPMFKLILTPTLRVIRMAAMNPYQQLAHKLARLKQQLKIRRKTPSLKRLLPRNWMLNKPKWMRWQDLKIKEQLLNNQQRM